MLKISRHPEERSGGGLMRWWNGQRAARVLAYDERALLLERVAGNRSLAEMARTDRDDEASEIICAVAEKLHSARLPWPPELVPLLRWLTTSNLLLCGTEAYCAKA